MAKHLTVSTTYIVKLCADGVIERETNNKFDQDLCRGKYLAWLRSPERRSARVKEASAFMALKQRALQLRIAETERRLVPIEDMDTVLDLMCGFIKSNVYGMAAAVTRDLVQRRTIDAWIFDFFTRFAKFAEAEADKLGPIETDIRGALIDDEAAA